MLSACSIRENKKSFRSDIDFIYYTILEHHPGPCNKEDPFFLNTLEENYRRAQQRSDEASLHSFVKSFNDSHVYIDYFKKKDKSSFSTTEKNLSFFEKNEFSLCFKLETFVFNNSNKNQFVKLLQKAKNIKKYKTIIFDLRGNTGGNSFYGYELNNVIFGKKYSDALRYSALKNQYVDWRVSEGNKEHLENLYTKTSMSWVKEIASSLKKSLKNGDALFKEKTNFLFIPKVLIPKNLDKEYIVLIDHSNVSAALDFIDDIKILAPRVTLVSQKTKGDRLYMEVRGVELPSGIGMFYFPIKVYRNRLRKDNEAFEPDINLTADEMAKIY